MDNQTYQNIVVLDGQSIVNQALVQPGKNHEAEFLTQFVSNTGKYFT